MLAPRVAWPIEVSFRRRRVGRKAVIIDQQAELFPAGAHENVPSLGRANALGAAQDFAPGHDLTTRGIARVHRAIVIHPKRHFLKAGVSQFTSVVANISGRLR